MLHELFACAPDEMAQMQSASRKAGAIPRATQKF
jgi:hypothetical protein